MKLNAIPDGLPAAFWVVAVYTNVLDDRMHRGVKNELNER
jgi:hypothetical protein